MSTKVTTNFSTTTLGPARCAEAIKAMIPTDRSLFLWGPPGISKSNVAQQTATDLGVAFIDLRLTQMDPTDLRGIPYPTTVGGVEGVRWSTPYVMPQDLDLSFTVDLLEEETVIHFGNPCGSNGIYYCTTPVVEVAAIATDATPHIIETSFDKVKVALRDANGALTSGKVRVKVTGDTRGILALEEFNSAPPSVTAAAYQLTLDRAIGEYTVPKGVFIMGMGNRDVDKGITYKMPTPVMNRFVHIEMAIHFEDWQTWAIQREIHPQVVGFVSAFPTKLQNFDPGSAARGFATPRSWHFVSDILTKNEDLNETVLSALVSGAIGEGIAAEFMEFRRIAKELPRTQDILSGDLKKFDSKIEVSLAYALTTSLCYQLKQSADKEVQAHGKDWRRSNAKSRIEWMEQSDNFLLFMMNNFQHEICIMGAKAALAIHELPFGPKQPGLAQFTSRYRGLIV